MDVAFSPWQSPPATTGQLAAHLDSEPKVTDEKRFEALRLACEGSPHATPTEIVERAKAYFNFLKGE